MTPPCVMMSLIAGGGAVHLLVRLYGPHGDQKRVSASIDDFLLRPCCIPLRILSRRLKLDTLLVRGYAARSLVEGRIWTFEMIEQRCKTA